MSIKRALYFDCYSGISGDMILGALVDLGVDLNIIRKELKGLGIQGYKLTSKRVDRSGLSGIKVDVTLNNSKIGLRKSRSFTDIKLLLEKSRLPKKVKSDAIEVFRLIGKAEAHIHRTSINKIHFHEVGSIDSIVDIVGSALGLNMLNVQNIFSSSLNTGEGMVKCEHGTLPVPAPATLKLLKGIPCYSNGIKKELTTPTGAAIIGYFAEEFGSMPNMHILDTGYGAGGHKLKEIPNLLRVTLGEIKNPIKSHTIKIIETNIDDMNPEFYEHVMNELFNVGAVDVYFTSIYMKKNRPGTLLSVLVSCDNFDAAVRVILAETSTFGIRYYTAERNTLKREEKTIKTSFGKVRVKIGFLNKSIHKISPEYEDCKKIAVRKKIAVKKVYDEVLRLAEDFRK